MKVTLSIVACTLVVLLHQMQAPMAQTCSEPRCTKGTYDARACHCTSESRDSTCPSGFREITKRNGLCACEHRTIPKCPTGFSLDSARCSCNIRAKPTCPALSELSTIAYCTGTVSPTCPQGAVQHGCRCVEDEVRTCIAGTLSSNGCKCAIISNPTCSSGCRLTKNRGCRCESYVQCYSSSRCGGQSTHHSNWQDCCETSSSRQQKYYQIGTGSCTPCR